MQTPLLQYHSNGDISLIKQFLLTLPVFNEIHYFLDNEKFYDFLKSVDVHPVFSSQPFQLKTTSTYLFLSKGMLISNKQKRQNYQKLTRLSKTIKMTQIYLSKDNLDPQKSKESSALKTIEPYSLFNEPLLYNPNYQAEKLFFVSQNKKAAIIEINFSKIDQEILNQLRQKHNQKLKFITSLNIFKKVQKYLIENSLSKFELLKVYFDQCLMKQPNLRNNHFFLLTTGEVQVVIQNKDEVKKSYLTKSPALLGFQKLKSIKSVTEYCLCYCIEKNDVSQILKRNLQGKYKNSQTEEFLNKIAQSIVNENQNKSLQNSSVFQTSRLMKLQQKKVIIQRNPTAPILPQLNSQNQSFLDKSKSYLHKSPQNKGFRIKQHFPNFINGHLSILDSNKPDSMGKLINNVTVLYEMKSLEPKSPQMQEINKRLRIERLNKVKRCRQNIEQTKQNSLSSVNLRVYEQFQNSKIINKIRRKIEQEIIKKQRIHKNWRSNAHNAVSFNKIADLAIHK